MSMILSWHGNTAAKSVTPSRRRFYGGFSPFSCLLRILLIHNAIRDFLIFRHVFRLLKTVQNASNIVNLASPSSQSCTLTLTILQPHFDYLAPQNTQDDTPKGWKQHPKPYFPPLEAWFSCRGESAWKCQPQYVYDIFCTCLTTLPGALRCISHAFVAVVSAVPHRTASIFMTPKNHKSKKKFTILCLKKIKITIFARTFHNATCFLR